MKLDVNNRGQTPDCPKLHNCKRQTLRAVYQIEYPAFIRADLRYTVYRSESEAHPTTPLATGV